jgi:hypothetical protein
VFIALLCCASGQGEEDVVQGGSVEAQIVELHPGVVEGTHNGCQ